VGRLCRRHLEYAADAAALAMPEPIVDGAGGGQSEAAAEATTQPGRCFLNPTHGQMKIRLIDPTANPSAERPLACWYIGDFFPKASLALFTASPVL